MIILAGDIGGTKTRLGIYLAAAGELEPIAERTFASGDYGSLAAILEQFLQGLESKPDTACLGLAGPVYGRKCRITNLPWDIDADGLEQRLGIASVKLLNDLEATAWGLQALDSSDFHTLQSGNSDARGNRMIIAAGTGLGEAALYWDGFRHHPYPTEGGHSDFAPRDELQFALSAWLRERHGHVSWEHVISGPGLVNIYHFLLDHHRVTPGERISELMNSTDPAAVIATSTWDPSCREAMELFTNLYAAETANQALKQMALGGVYIGGGIAPKILEWLTRPQFIRTFLDKGKMGELMERMPVKVILNDRAALLGPAVYLSQTSTG